MPLYIADYLVKTSHLGALQSGAYLHLIMHYWQSGCVPDNDTALMRVARMTAPEWKRNKSVIQAFFYDGWRHKRIDDELAHAADVSSKRRASAEQGLSKRAAKAEQLLSDSSANGAVHARGLSQSLSEKKEKKEPSAPKKNGTRLHEDWKPNEASCARAAAKGFSNSQIEEIAEDLRVWANGKGISRQNWDATFDGFIRRDAKQRSQHTGNRKVSPHERLIEAIADHVRQDRDRTAIGETPLSLPNPGYGPGGKPPH